MLRIYTCYIFLGCWFVLSGVICDKELRNLSNTINARLAVEVLKLSPGRNVVVSILPIRWTLCKLAEIADNAGKPELMTALGYVKEKDLEKCFTPIKTMYNELKRNDLILINNIYINYTDDVKENFIVDSLQKNGVRVEKVGFNYPSSATGFINRWIETATLKRITGPLEHGDINNNNTTMISISALHFKGNWEFPFDVRDTKEVTFRQSRNKLTKVKMMRKMESVLYYEDAENDVKCEFQSELEWKIKVECYGRDVRRKLGEAEILLKLYFASVGAAIMYAMPSKSDGLPTFLEKLSKEPDYMERIQKNMRYTELGISIPIMKIKTFVDWTEFLKGSGVKKIFSINGSGLNGILKPNSTTRDMFLNLIKQRSFFELDEMGMFRSLKQDTAKLRPRELGAGFTVPEFVADRPFYFVIRLQTGSDYYDLFNGVFNG